MSSFVLFLKITGLLICILSGGFLFNSWLRKHWMVGASIGIVAIVSSYYLFQSILQDVGYSQASSNSSTERSPDGSGPDEIDEPKLEADNYSEPLQVDQLCTASSEIEKELPKLKKTKEMYEKNLITSSEMSEFRQNSVQRLEVRLIENLSSFDVSCLRQLFERNIFLYNGGYITSSDLSSIRGILYGRLADICERKSTQDEHSSCLRTYSDLYKDRLITSSQLSASRENTFNLILTNETQNLFEIEESIDFFRGLYEENLITSSQMENARKALLDASGELLELQ